MMLINLGFFVMQGHTEWDLKTEWTFSRFPLLSFLFETEYNGRIGLSEATSKLCYRYNGEECSQDNKVTHTFIGILFSVIPGI